MGSLEEGSPDKENSPKRTPKQPQAHLGVELRDVRSSLREVEKLEGGKGRGCEKAGPLSLSRSLSLSLSRSLALSVFPAGNSTT